MGFGFEAGSYSCNSDHLLLLGGFPVSLAVLEPSLDWTDLELRSACLCLLACLIVSSTVSSLGLLDFDAKTFF